MLMADSIMYQLTEGTSNVFEKLLNTCIAAEDVYIFEKPKENLGIARV